MYYKLGITNRNGLCDHVNNIKRLQVIKWPFFMDFVTILPIQMDFTTN